MTEGKKRGRPPGSKNRKSANGDGTHIPTSDDRPAEQAVNSAPKVAKEPLSEEQLQSLFFQHKQEYEKALASKKEADAQLKVVAKRIKSEGTKLSDIKLAIELEHPEASGDMRARLERELRVARWVGAPVGTQFSLLDEVDRTPIDERVREDGKRAGLRGEAGTAPSHLPGNLMSVWAEGYAEGQSVLASRFKATDAQPGPLNDDLSAS